MLTFYTNPLAYNPAKVAVMLAETKVPHKTVKVDLLGGGALKPDFMRKNPKAAVPIIEHNGKMMPESMKICQYLDTLSGSPLGGDKVDRAFVDKFVEEIDAFDGNLYAFSNSSAGILNTIRGMDKYRVNYAKAQARRCPDLKEAYEAKAKSMAAALDEVNDQAKVAENESKLVKLLDTAETRLAPTTATSSEQETFLGGPAYSIADAMFAPLMYRVTMLGKHGVLIAPRPAVAAYMRRMRNRDSWKQAFGEADSAVGKLYWFLPALVKTKVCNLLRLY